MKYGLILIISVFLIGCGQQALWTADFDKEKMPFHKIIYLDKYYTDYLASLKSDSLNRKNIYSEKIQEPLIRDHFSNSVYSDLVRESISYPIADTVGLTRSVSELNANRIQIETLISSAFILCNKTLKNDSVTFYIVPSTSRIKDILKKMGGVIGQTAGSKQILITIDFSVNTWKEVLEYTVAHEFNHAYWTNTNPIKTYKWTLLKFLVFEGKADSFAHLLYPKVKAPWTASLTEQEKTDLWRKIKPDLQSADSALIGGILFGSKDYPTWKGYTLGYDILQTAFKNHPDILETNWTTLDADKLLELSSYN